MKLRELLSSATFVLIFILVSRLATVGVPNLIDTTDARYASIAANMAIDSNWIVPRVHQEGEMMGYWSKPPMAFWVQAGSIHLFGFNEWAVRMPGVLWLALGTALIAWLAERWYSRAAASLVAVLTGSSALLFALGSVTMTDQPLFAAFVAAMVAFGMFFETGNRWWGRLGFLALGCALLSKGPIGLMLPAASLAAFVALSHSWRRCFALPWGSGIALMLLVSAPWYLAMEQQEPGFLKYFLLDENFRRLISAGLELRHGTAHPTFRGYAVICLAIVTLPWVLILPWKLRGAQQWRALLPNAANGLTASARELYLLCWFAAPIVPLAIGKQVLAYYLLPLVPGFMLWFVVVNARLQFVARNSLVTAAGIFTVIYTVILVASGPLGVNERRSTRPIIEAAAAIVGEPQQTVLFADRVPDSAYFYLASDVSKELRFAALPLERIRAESPSRWVIVRAQDIRPAPLLHYSVRHAAGKWVLLERKD